MTTAATCERCGASVTAGGRFCIACGADISGQQGNIATQHVTSLSTKAQMKRGLMDAVREATLGDYEILAELGAGGMATVFLGHDIHLDRKVAIKVMSPQLVAGPDMVERFKLEARTAAALSHPNIIPIFAVKQEGDLLFFVMKFVEGRPLDSIIKKEAPLPVPMVRQIVGKVAEALGYAHRKGVVHRDIKPANIMIDTEGLPIVTDFGIAKVADKQGLTMTGATIGTPTYMSPEQCNAQPITGASDQYSLGVMAFEMLTGKPLFDGDSVMTIMFKHVHEEAPSLATLADKCPPDLAATVERMIGKRPDDRFPTMEDVVKALQAPTLSFDDPMRTKLIEFAMQGENRTVLQRVSTPRSPIPVTAQATRSKTAPAARTGATTRPSQEPTELISTAEKEAERRARQATKAKKKGRGMLVALTVVLLAGGGAAAAVLKPWEAGAAAGPAPAEPAPVAVAPAPGAQDPAPAQPEPVPPAAQQQPPAAPPAAQQTPQARPAAPAPVRQVRILGAPGTMGIGEPIALSSQVMDANGAVVSDRAVRWTSSNPDVVRVSAAGVATAVAAGSATITAEAEGQRGTATITVSPEGVASVRTAPSSVTLEVGGTARVSATVTGTSGGRLDRAVTWTSSRPGVVSVGPDGTLTGQAPGNATVTAAADGQQATVAVTVEAAAPSEADLREQAAQAIQAYARALESKDVDRVRRLYPSMTGERENQLRQALPSMNDLRVQLTVSSVRLAGDRATAVVTGLWRFSAGGRAQELPGNNTYDLRYTSGSWVITDIR